MSLSAENLEYVCSLMYREAGIVFEESKGYLIVLRLQPLARAAGHPNLNDYVKALPGSPQERMNVVDALTINETSWFRDRAPFDWFAETCIPDLLKQRKFARRLRIWSAACSSGQEAYSLAMLADKNVPSDWDVQILATDLSPTMVERVRSGRYSRGEMARGLGDADLKKYFTPDGDSWVVSPRLSKLVTAETLNLARPFRHPGHFDVVFLRNVLIYFDDATVKGILNRVYDCLSPGGYLILGQSENSVENDSRWTRTKVGTLFVHQRA